jgi:hypothetical protein
LFLIFKNLKNENKNNRKNPSRLWKISENFSENSGKKSFQIGPSKREDAFFGLLEKLWMQCGRSGGAMQR